METATPRNQRANREDLPPPAPLSYEKIGKIVGGARYVHVSNLARLSPEQRTKFTAATQIFSLEPGVDFNVLKLDMRPSSWRLSLLLYEDFSLVPFPALLCSWRIDLEKETVQRRDYAKSPNPPILHRKELLLSPDDPDAARFGQLTRALEQAGLLRDTRNIGFRMQWEQRLAVCGWRVEGHRLLQTAPAGYSAQGAADATLQKIEREKTAITRYNLSRPFQFLAKYGYLDGQSDFFDYGCGKGDDLRILLENGIEAAGWDPHFASEAPLISSKIVNLGFVINVIESKQERAEALARAFSLAKKLLVVSAMLAHECCMTSAVSYGDGLVTSRGTFQKYYTQSELKAYLEEVHQKEAIAVGPGVFFLFKDSVEEQRFLRRRQQRACSTPRLPSPRVEAGKTRACRRLEECADLLDVLWERAATLGRAPKVRDLSPELLGRIKDNIGSLGRALKLLWLRYSPAMLEETARSRAEDLLVYLALEVFNGRHRQRQYPEEVRQDCKHFFGTLAAAEQAASTLLFSAGKPPEVLKACLLAKDNGLGSLDRDHSLTIHTALVDRLPPILRVYAGCASRLIGDISIADLVKFHIKSGKFTLILVDNFFENPVPELKSRIKINLRSQAIDFFERGQGQHRSFLYLKSRFMAADQEGYEKQVAFDSQLVGLDRFDFSGFGPTVDAFHAGLQGFELAIEGMALVSMAKNVNS